MEFLELDAFLESVNYWLHRKDTELRNARYVFSGKEVSAVLLDPAGGEFPRDWYPHMLRYEPGRGLVKAGINRRYMFPSDCDCAEHRAWREEVAA